jgi:excisionase family DNA binding protein
MKWKLWWVPVTEIAERLGVSRPTAHKYVREGKIGGRMKKYGRVRVDRVEFEKWLSEQKADPLPPKYPFHEMVYFIEQVHDNGVNPIKIGFSNGGLSGRLAALRSASPYPLRVLGYMKGSREDEQRLHKRFRRDKLHGEWFKPSKNLKNLLSSPEVTKDP